MDKEILPETREILAAPAYKLFTLMESASAAAREQVDFFMQRACDESCWRIIARTASEDAAKC